MTIQKLSQEFEQRKTPEECYQLAQLLRQVVHGYHQFLALNKKLPAKIKKPLDGILDSQEMDLEVLRAELEKLEQIVMLTIEERDTWMKGF